MEEIVQFIKKHRFDIIIVGSFIAFCFDIYLNKHTFSFTIIAFYIFGYAADSERSKTNIAERKKLRLKGLTPADLNNIKFVKSWEEIRKKGLIKYTLVDGGIFFGFALCGVISILCVLVTNDLIGYMARDPSNMFNFIGYTYIAGVIGGTIIYRLLWIYKERKFIRLTDPLH